MDPVPPEPVEMAAKVQSNRRMLAVENSANLKYHLNHGTVIEATGALETLLTNPDIDLSLPMSMVAPPYAAQYLRFGDAAMRCLKVPNSDDPTRVFDGVFCFYAPPSERCATGPNAWTLEFIFISKRQDRFNGYVTLLGETDRGNTTVGNWLDRVLGAIGAEPDGGYRQRMHTAVGYVVKVFLYMALKQARIIERHDYDAAMRRVTGLGERKRIRLLQRAGSLYNGILVGPEALPSSTVRGGGAQADLRGAGLDQRRASQWRRAAPQTVPCACVRGGYMLIEFAATTADFWRAG